MAASERRLDWIVLLTIVATAAWSSCRRSTSANAWRADSSAWSDFSRAVAAGDLAAHLSVTQRDELGELEESLDEMGRQLGMWLRGMQAESDKVRGILGAMIEGVVVISATGDVILMNRRAEEIFALAARHRLPTAVP